MLTVDENFIEKLKDKDFMPQLAFAEPRPWHDDKLAQFTAALRKQLPSWDKGDKSA